MQAGSGLDELRRAHAPEAIRRRLAKAPLPSYLGDAVLGAIDGCVTTFALVAGAVGAGFSAVVAIVLGIANLVADGVSMAVSNYQGTSAELARIAELRREEYEHLRQVPQGEMEEIRQIYARKGFSGAALEHVVETITADPDRWVDTMLVEEHGVALHARRPLVSALTTFTAFVVVGSVPLLPLVFGQGDVAAMFRYSVVLAGLAFFLVGVLKGWVIGRKRLRFGLQSLAAGMVAAGCAYIIGALLRDVYGVT